MHINNLKLLAVFNCVGSFLDELKNSKLRILSDNITTVYYINKLGGTQSKDLCLLAMELWQTLNKNNIDCEAHHIPGVCNVRTDFFLDQFATDTIIIVVTIPFPIFCHY